MLEEETRLFVCEFCRVRSCISHSRFPRYMFSPSPEIDPDTPLYYLPYWRFKGVRYTCSPTGVTHQFIDISRMAMTHPPNRTAISLGLRSQSLALRLISSETAGTFLTPRDYSQTLAAMDNRFRPGNKTGFQEDIGETTSLIYAPFYIRDDLMVDGILNKPVGPVETGESDIRTQQRCRPEKEIHFLPGLCPSCGWDLTGHSDSLVLVCKNCNTLWRSRGKKLARIRFACNRPKNETDVLLPFWQIHADISGLDLERYSDLIRFANLPQLPAPDNDKQTVSFWAPAFKIRPDIFLRLTTQLAVLQPGDTANRQLGDHPLAPANLPSVEAVESIRVTLGALMKPARRYLPQLIASTITPTAIKLVYLPFESKSHELFHPELRVSINKNSLKLSGNL